MSSKLVKPLTQRLKALALFSAIVIAGGIVISSCDEFLSGGKKSTAIKNVTFAFDQTSAEVRGGQSVTLHATVRDPDGNVVPAAVTTYSIAAADQTYATINAATGVVTAATVLAEAQHSITATATTVTPHGYSDPSPVVAQVTVRSRVNSVSLSTQQTSSPSSVTIRIGDPAFALLATPAFAPGSPQSPAVNFTYASSNTAQVAVDAQGKLTALAPSASPVSITASAEGSTSSPVMVTVLPALVATLVVAPPSLSVRVGDQATLAASVVNPPAGTGTITWDSPSKTLVTVDANGKITGVAPTALNTPVRVTATYKNGATTLVGYSDITVTALPPVVTISPRPTAVQAGQTVRLTASVANPVGTTVVTWETSDATHADVDATGLVTGKVATTAGSPVRITAKYLSGGTTYSDFVDLAVTAAANSPTISFSPTSTTITVGSTSQVTVTVNNPIAGGTLSVATADASIATFSQSSNSGSSASGTVVGRLAGSTPLVAVYTAGTTTVTNSAPITVSAGGSSRVAKIIIEPRDEEVTANVGFAYKVRFFDASGNVTTPETAAEGGLLRFINSSDAVGTVTQSITDPTIAVVASKTAGTSSVTAVYSRNGQDVASDNTSFSVYAAGTVGHYGSLTISTAGDVRQVALNQGLLFQVIVRDQNNVVQTMGVTGLVVTAFDGTTTVTLTRTNDPTGYFYIVQGTKVGALLLKADIMGAATTIPLVVTP